MSLPEVQTAEANNRGSAEDFYTKDDPPNSAWSKLKAAILYDPRPGEALPKYLFFKNRWFRGVVFLVMCLLNTLVYYGWQQFSQMLFRNGAYRWKCNEAELEDRDDYCQSQYNAVQNLYTIGLACEFIFGVLAGIFLDHIGPWFTGLVGSSMFFLGWMCLIYSGEGAQLYIPGMVLLAGSINLVAFPCLCLADLFPSKGGLSISLVVAAQTAGTSVAPILMAIWDANPGATYEQIVWVYLAVCFFPVTALYLLCVPYKRFVFLEDTGKVHAGDTLETARTADVAHAHNVTGGRNSSQLEMEQKKLDDSDGASSVAAALEVPPFQRDMTAGLNPTIGVKEMSMRFRRNTFLRQLAAPEFIFFTAFYVLQVLQYGYYPTTVLDEYGRDVSNFQGYILPTQAIFGAAFGLVVDKTKTPIICGVLVMAMTTAYVLALIRSTGLQYLTSVLYVVSNSYIYTVKYTYAAEIFPTQHFGVLIGLIGCIAGTITLVNVPIQNANNYVATCIGFIGVGCVAGLIVIWLYWRERKGIHYRNDFVGGTAMHQENAIEPAEKTN